MKSHLKNDAIPPLVDLCLYVVCKNLNGYDYLNTLPDFLRQRMGMLFKQEQMFQESIESLNFVHCSTLTDDELKNVAHLTSLKNLNLTHCDKLSAMSMCFVGQLHNLRVLRLSHCPKVSPGFYWLGSLVHLHRLEAAFCEVQDPVVPFISKLPSLTHLNLMCNRLTDEGCTNFVQLTTLTCLNLSMNPLITDKTLSALAHLTNLQSLNLNYCKLLSSDGLAILSKGLPNLQQLDIIGCDRALTDVKQRPLILLAEDSKVQARMISMVLNRYNFDVEVATNGEMALELFRANPKYDLILMDVMMPVMDGISCVKQIREFEAQRGLKRTPIIIQTADPREDQRRTCLEAGCDEFLPKPLDRACISLAKELMESSYAQ